MTKAELIELLAEFPDEAEIRMMTQEGYPLESKVRGVWYSDETEDVDFEPSHAPDHGVIYLVEGRQMGYGTRNAWEQAVSV